MNSCRCSKPADESSGELGDNQEQHWEVIERILFVYAKLNPGVKYVQVRRQSVLGLVSTHLCLAMLFAATPGSCHMSLLVTAYHCLSLLVIAYHCLSGYE